MFIKISFLIGQKIEIPVWRQVDIKGLIYKENPVVQDLCYRFVSDTWGLVELKEKETSSTPYSYSKTQFPVSSWVPNINAIYFLQQCVILCTSTKMIVLLCCGFLNIKHLKLILKFWLKRLTACWVEHGRRPKGTGLQTDSVTACTRSFVSMGHAGATHVDTTYEWDITSCRYANSVTFFDFQGFSVALCICFLEVIWLPILLNWFSRGMESILTVARGFPSCS